MSWPSLFQLRPFGWETDPEEERFKLSTIDHTLNCAYNHYAVFFRLDDAEKQHAVDLLRAGLERTLSQARHMCSTIEADPEGGHSFVKRKDSTVDFVVHWLDPLEDHPSLDDIEKADFSGHSLRDVNLWSIPEMTWGERPEAEPDRHPPVSAFQVTLTKGGLVFSMHHHHYSCDVMGWNAFTHQLAENCYAIAKSSEFPPWDPAGLDVSRFTKIVPEESLIDGPSSAQRHPDHPETQAVLFHLPKDKAAALKELATPAKSTSRWISTYDAVCAHIWRTLSSARAPLYDYDASAKPWFGEAINMRPRLHNPPVPERTVRNVILGAFSDTAPVSPLTAGEIISDAPLTKLAFYIRELTESCTEEHFLNMISAIAPIRDKRGVSLRPDSYPPMSMFVTDHRSADVSHFDFGFAKPITYRHLWGNSNTAGVIVIYANPDGGWMFTINMEKQLVPMLIETPEWNKYFEYRGID